MKHFLCLALRYIYVYIYQDNNYSNDTNSNIDNIKQYYNFILYIGLLYIKYMQYKHKVYNIIEHIY